VLFAICPVSVRLKYLITEQILDRYWTDGAHETLLLQPSSRPKERSPFRILSFFLMMRLIINQVIFEFLLGDFSGKVEMTGLGGCDGCVKQKPLATTSNKGFLYFNFFAIYLALLERFIFR
jgi:hypothetical protein